ncbi:hypothetical protein NDU88_000852 [Pleurodeles waltl]|uniref:Uncharacterized protein n=1 Tax=Pleurodeles waltl TaxID=8319 RepID=A0AAV7WGN7_PLEWA|nr:hypothetical protein NDU88_000852 [Pleurodeles waltl]
MSNPCRWRIRPRCVSSGDPPSRTSVSSAVQGPQGPPGRIPSAPETRAFALRISVDSGRVAPGHEAPYQFDHSSRHFRGRTGPVRQARFAGVCRCSKWVSATPEAPSARHSVPHAGSAPQQGSRQPGPPPGSPVVSPYLRGWGRRARTHPRSPSHRPPRSREHKALHEQPCSNPQAGGGPPRLPSRSRLAPPQTARGPTPSRVSAHSLSPAPDINAATGPRPRVSPAASDGLRQARSVLHRCSGRPHGSPHSLPVNLPRGEAQDNRRSLGPSGADGSSVRHLWLRGHAPGLSLTYMRLL